MMLTLIPLGCIPVMRGLDPRIHVFLTGRQVVDGRVKPGHDDC
jgi:hypothetical protein